MHYSPRPKFIREAANAFVADTIGTWDIVAMHWRYDKEDFMVHCQKVSINWYLEFQLALNLESRQPRDAQEFKNHNSGRW